VKSETDQQIVGLQVSSTETGVIFGNIFYDGASVSNDSQCVVLNDIHIDILDYITPGYCNEAQVSRRALFCPRRRLLIPLSSCSSGACGPNSNGRTRSTFLPRLTTSELVSFNHLIPSLLGTDHFFHSDRSRPHHVFYQHGLSHTRRCPRRRLWLPISEPLRSLVVWRRRSRKFVDREVGRWFFDGSHPYPVKDSRYRFVARRPSYCPTAIEFIESFVSYPIMFSSWLFTFHSSICVFPLSFPSLTSLQYQNTSSTLTTIRLETP
jgi:hypothetical protein